MHPIDIVRPHTTPPTLEIDEFLDLDCPGSGSTAITFLTDHEWSPQSVQTAGTTPPTRSPAPLRECGPAILPRVRSQDQVMARVPGVAPTLGHARTQSLPAQHARMSAYHPPGSHMSAYAPKAADFFDFNTPTSAMSMQTYAAYQMSGLQEQPSMQPVSAPMSVVRSHSRNTSNGSIDAVVVNKFGYPTYRQSPTPQPHGLSCTADAMSHLAPMAMLNGNVRSYPTRPRSSISPSRSRLSVGLEAEPSCDMQQTSMRSYLTARNPTPQTVQQVRMHPSVNANWYWWDVRNVYEWTDFNIETLQSIPVFANLLETSVAASSLPEPARVNLVPDSRAQLAELCASYHLYKLNKALALAQGSERQLTARALTTCSSARQEPEFVSNAASDVGRTFSSSGRVVGIVRSFEEWNTGMRSEDPIKRVEYLRSLAFLHHQMREHGCRYGFIITEIELVCVRAGGPKDSIRIEPYFGYLELSAPISISTHGPARDGSLQMTVGIALWWLHILAGDQTLPGQLDWRLEVGAISAGTRRIHLSKDAWIGNPTAKEKRTAKNARGWVMPNESISPKERRTGRRRA